MWYPSNKSFFVDNTQHSILGNSAVVDYGVGMLDNAGICNKCNNINKPGVIAVAKVS